MLQKDLNTLGGMGGRKWMKINPGKFKGIRFTRARVKNSLGYSLCCKKFRKLAIINRGNDQTKQFKLGGSSKLHSAKSLEGTSLCNACSQKRK
jgi:hypothetical protein